MNLIFRHILELWILALLVSSCAETSSSDSSISEKEEEPDSTEYYRVKDSIRKVEIKVELDSLLFLRDELLKDFDQIPGHCGQPTYCHKNFWGSYAVRNHVLVCGVDTFGREFLVANTYLPLLIPDDPYPTAEIVMETGDSIFQTDSNVQKYQTECDTSVLPGMMYVCACYPIMNYYTNGKENGVVRAIARHYKEPTKYYFKFKNGKKDHQLGVGKKFGYGFKETVELAGVLLRICDLRGDG